MRGSEILSGIKVKYITWMNLGKTAFKLHLPRTKTERSGEGADVYFSQVPGQDLCAVGLLKRWIKRRSIADKGEALLFPAKIAGPAKFNTNKTASLKWLRKTIKAAVQSVGMSSADYSAHSLRAGGATDLFNMKVPFFVIKKMGRWRSNAALVYFRDEDNVGKMVGIAFSKLSVRLRKQKGRST